MLKLKRPWLAIILVFITLDTHAVPLILKAKYYLDVSTGKLVKPANVLIEDGKIVSINPQKIPKNTQIINKPKLILLPGLMDMHVHLPIDKPTYPLELLQDDGAMATVRAIKNAKTLLLAGFTTIRCVGQIYPGTDFVDIAVAKASEKNWIPAPHIYAAGNAIGMTGGIMDPYMVGGYAPNIIKTSYRNGVADGVDEVIKAVRYQIKHGAKVIKFGATNGVLTESSQIGNQEYSFEEMRAIVDEAHRQGITVAAHAHGTNGILAAIRAGVNSIEHGSMLNKQTIKLMKEKGVYLVPTTYLLDSLDIKSLNKTMQRKANTVISLAKHSHELAIKEGVKIAFGTDSPVIPHGQNAREFQALVHRGMTNLEAIQTATINSAELLQLKDRGQIKPGFHADLVGVIKSPLDNIRALENINFVMKDGKVYKDN